MTKIVYNNCYGGFNLSEEAVMLYAKKKGITIYPERDKRYTSLRIVYYWKSF